MLVEVLAPESKSLLQAQSILKDELRNTTIPSSIHLPFSAHLMKFIRVGPSLITL